MKRRMVCLLLVLLLSLPLPAAYAATEGAKSDVQGHWAEKQLTDWIGKGLIKGYGDGSFRPNGTITRAEFMALVNRSFDLTDKSEVTFNDVDSKRWDYEQVAIALHAGYISGFSDGTIRTSNKVTRQEAAVMLAKLLKLDTSAGADLSKYTDAARIPAWSKPMIDAVVAKGIMAGFDNGTLGFDKVLTRAETIVMLNRALSVKVTVAYNQAGAYGPETGSETIVGDVLLNASGVSLRNTTIKGNLTFGEGIGEGEAMILNVQVDGDTFIRGGGMHSIYIVGSTLGEVEVNKPSGDVRVAIDDQSKIDHIITYSNTTIESATAAQAKAAVAPQIAKEPEVKVLAAAPQKPIAPTTPPVGSKPEVWSEYFKEVTKYQEDLLAYALYISSLPNVTSAGSNTTTSVYGNVSDVNVTGNNSQVNVSGLVNTLLNSGRNSKLNVGGGVGILTDSGSNSQTTIRDFVNDASISGNNTQLLVGGNTGNIAVSGDNSSIEVAGQTGEATIVGNDTQLRLVGANNINLVGNNNTITSRGEIGNLIVGETSSGNQLGLVDNASDIAKLIPLEKANKYSGVSTSNPPDRTALLPLTPTPTTPATSTTLSIVSAKAVGAKKIEVKFNKSIDPASIRLSVSKNGSPIAVQAVPDNETKVYTLTLAEKLTEGTYSVTASYTDSSIVIGSAEARVEDEKIAKISFVNPSDTVAKGTRIGIEVEAKNQYGESLPNLSGFEVNSTVPVEIAAGRPIVVVDTSSQSLQPGISIIPITVTNRVSQVTVTQNFRLGSVPIVSKVELRGSFRGIDGQEVSQVDWAHIYHMNFDLYDQYGHMLLYPLSSGAGTVQTSLNPYLSNSVGALGEAPAGEPGTFSLPITVETSVPQEGKDYTFTIYVGGASASKTFHVGKSSISPLDLINAASASGVWTGVTAFTFSKAGVSGVTSDRLDAIFAALNVNGSTPRTVAEIQAIVLATNRELLKQEYLKMINSAAASANWTNFDNATFVLAGVTGVNSSNFSAVTAALNVNGSTPRTVAQIQAVVDLTINELQKQAAALNTINAAAGTWTDVTADTFTAAGVTGVTPSNLEAVKDALDQDNSAPWTVAELQAIVNDVISELAKQAAALNTINTAAGTWTGVTADTFTAAGVTGVTPSNLEAVKDALDQDNSDSWTVAELQAIVDDVISELAKQAAALNTINAAAGTWTGVTADTFTAAGVTGVTPSNLQAVKDALDEDNSDSWTVAELQAIVDDVISELAKQAAALNTINAAVGTWTGVTADTFTAAGVTGVTPSNLQAVKDALDEDNSAPWTVAELQAIVNDVIGDAKLAALNTINAAAAAGTWTGVTADTFTTAGVTGVDASNLAAVTAALNVNGSTQRTIAQIQAVVNLVLINGASRSDNWSGITVETFVSAGMNDVTEENIDSIMIVLAYGYIWDLDFTDLQKAIDGIIVNIGIALSEINQAAYSNNWDPIYEDQLSMFSRGIDGSNVTQTIVALQLHGQRVWTPAELYVEINRILEELEQ